MHACRSTLEDPTVATCAVCVANIYMTQPLLRLISGSFGGRETAAAPVVWMAQIGYALGILIFVPLGDRVDARRIMLALISSLAVVLTVAGSAASIVMLAALSLAIGCLAPVAQVIIPFAAGLAEPGARGRVLGTIQAGVIIGIVSGRTVAGLIASAAGWRAVYFCSAAVSLLLLVALSRLLPARPPQQRTGLVALWTSLPSLFLRERDLRTSCFSGGLMGAVFSAFWTTLVFRVAAAPYHYGAAQAGLFGLLGILAAGAAAPMGRISDRIGARAVNAASVGVMLAAIAILYFAGHYLAGLIAGAILVDLAVQGNQISNQARIFAIPTAAHNRLNTVYMIFRFSGMAAGSLLGVAAWSMAGWTGVCAFGIGALLVAMALQMAAAMPQEAGRFVRRS